MSGKKNASANRRILYDGWPLVFEPESPAALHLFELIDALPEGFEALLALPGPVDLPAGLSAQADIIPFNRRRASPMAWEQRSIPAAARRAGVGLIHTTSRYPPLFSALPCLVSPVASGASEPEAGLPEHLRGALGSGGLAGARAILWPEDLPDPQPPYPAPLWRLGPVVHPAFHTAQSGHVRLPDSYVLVPGPLEHEQMAFLSAAWSWVAAGLDESWFLVVSGLDSARLEHLRQMCYETCAFDRVETVDLRTPEQRAEALQKAAVVLFVSDPAPWGDALLQALACARPIAAPLTACIESRVGPAAYLTPPGDSRALGAAVLSLLMEEPLSEDLSRKAQARCAAWNSTGFGHRLAQIYERAEHPD